MICLDTIACLYINATENLFTSTPTQIFTPLIEIIIVPPSENLLQYALLFKQTHQYNIRRYEKKKPRTE